MQRHDDDTNMQSREEPHHRRERHRRRWRCCFVGSIIIRSCAAMAAAARSSLAAPDGRTAAASFALAPFSFSSSSSPTTTTSTTISRRCRRSFDVAFGCRAALATPSSSSPAAAAGGGVRGHRRGHLPGGADPPLEEGGSLDRIAVVGCGGEGPPDDQHSHRHAPPPPPSPPAVAASSATAAIPARLSKAHRSMMAKSSSMRRQRFVTGRYPLYVSVVRNPTNRFLGLAESRIYLNGTSIDRSLASYDAFHWLDDDERRELHGDYEFLSLELLAEIHVRRPGYVNVLPGGGAGSSLLPSAPSSARSSSSSSPPPSAAAGVGGGGRAKAGAFGGLWKSWISRDADAAAVAPSPSGGGIERRGVVGGERLWMTGFSLTNQRGEMHALDVKSGVMSSATDRTSGAIRWPNEVASVPGRLYRGADRADAAAAAGGGGGDDGDGLEDALLVTDGFLVPGKDKGGLYVVRNPGNGACEWADCLTGTTNLRGAPINVGEGDWFYHKATWMDLTGDGRLSILAARARVTLRNNNADHEGVKTFGKGQLVWLECPRPHSFVPGSRTPLDVDGTVFDPFNSRNTPWKLR